LYTFLHWASLESLEILLNNSCPVIFYCYVEAAVIYAFQCDFYRIETHDWYCSVARKNCRRKSSSKTHYRKIAEEEEAARPIKAWQKNIAEGSSCFSQLPPVLQQIVTS